MPIGSIEFSKRSAAPAAPAAGKKLYLNASGKFSAVDEAGNVEPLGSGAGSWDDLTGKPPTFPPTAHTHTTSEVTGLDTTLAGKAPTSHTHSSDVITEGTTNLFFTAARAVAALASTLTSYATQAWVAAQGYVITTDSRLSNARTPTAHSHTTSEVTGLDAALAGKLNLSESSYIIAKPGDNLATKYTAAKALTPNGTAKSATNRAYLIVFPGRYTLSAELAIDTEFVDVIGLGAQTRTPAVLIAGNTLNVSANDVHVSGVSVGAQSFKITGDKPLQVFENCTGGGSSFGGGIGVTASGTFTNCTGGFYSFAGGGGTASGTFKDCTGEGSSFAGGGGTASGTFTNCTGGSSSFGGTDGTPSGGTASGTFTNCTGGSYSFAGGGGTASGTFNDCTGEDYSFAGGGGTASGTFTDCTSGSCSFGGTDGTTSGGTASGTFKDCTGEGSSFAGGGGTASGTFTDCRSGGNSFGASGGTASGTFRNCRLTAETFSALTAPATGKAIMVNCLDGNGNLNSGQAPL